MATNRTVIFCDGNSPAVRSAVAVSRGKAVRIMDEARVRGRSLSGRSESGMPAVSEGPREEGILGEVVWWSRWN